MKTEKEIRDEIEAINRDDERARKEYKDGEIPKEILKSKLLQNSAMRLALKWVLGENDRYD
jgi:hypothetical protein